MIRSYDELTGGFGRAVHYRAERHLVRDIFAGAAAEIRIDGRSYPLHDLSMNGVSFTSPVEPIGWSVGGEHDVAVLVHGEEVHRGAARVARLERTPQALRVGLELIQGFLDLHALRRRDEELALDRELHRGADRVRDRVPPAFRTALEELVHFVSFYKRLLDRHDARLAAEGSQAASEARAELAVRAADALRPRWQALVARCTDTAAMLFEDDAVRAAGKAYTEVLLTPLLAEAPVVRRAYDKPAGYAGDFEVMLYLYRNGFEGASVFGRVLHKLVCEEPLAKGVRTRKDLLKKLFTRERGRVQGRGQAGRPFRVTSLGCGPAREVVELIEAASSWPGPVEWVLIDQEERALSVAHQTVVRALAEHGREGRVHCLYLSFSQLLRDPSSALLGEPQDFVYCAGLFDYLGARRAQVLAAALYDRLGPGGLAAMGNAAAPNRWSWLIEFAADWTLIYRTEQDMREVSALLPRSVPREVVREPSEAYHFLLLRKP